MCVSFHAGENTIGTEGHGEDDPTVSLSSLPNDLSTDRVAGDETENVSKRGGGGGGGGGGRGGGG